MTNNYVFLILWGGLALMTSHVQRINAENCGKSKTMLIQSTSLYCGDCALTECVNENYTCQPIGLIFCSPSERHIEKCDSPAFCRRCEWKNGSRTGNCLEDVIEEVDPVKRCPDLDLSPGVRTTPSSSFTVGGSARFQCIDTNKVISGNQELSCLPDQTWDRSPPTCVKRCPDLDLSPGVRTTPGSSFTVGGSARFQCIDTNKVISGNLDLNCLSDQTWDKSPPTCVKRCPDMNLSPGVRTTPGSSFTVGGSARFQCSDTNKVLSGNLDLNCLSNQTWDKSPPTCVKRCPDLNLSPGVRTTPGSSFTVGGSARFQCIDTNKVLSGNQELSCLPDQTWDRSPPTCDIDNPNKCISGSWGDDCMNACGYCRTALSGIKSEYDCDPVTGACSQGCQEGYSGSNCDQAICKQDCGPGLCVAPDYCANCGDISLVSPNCEDIRKRGLLGPLYASVIFSVFLAICVIGSNWYKRRVNNS